LSVLAFHAGPFLVWCWTQRRCPGRLGGQALRSGPSFSPPALAVVWPFWLRALSAQEMGVLCVQVYPRPFAGREEGRQGQFYAGARLKPGWGCWPDSGVVHRPGHGSRWGLRIPCSVLSICRLGAARLGPVRLLRSSSYVARWLGVLDPRPDPTPLSVAVSIFEIQP
jgi:hypothetical protein